MVQDILPGPTDHRKFIKNLLWAGPGNRSPHLSHRRCPFFRQFGGEIASPIPCQSVHTTFCASRQVILALLVQFHSVGFSPLFHLLRFLEVLCSHGALSFAHLISLSWLRADAGWK